MTILAVDDRPKALSALVKAIRSAEPEAEVYGFSGSAEALRFARELCCDAAFLDIDMPEMDGLELAGRLRALYPRINIIFVTGFTEYTGEAISQRASGYVTKPVTPEKIREELDNLRYPVEDRKRKRVQFRCFGNFEVFLDEKPMCFKHGKTKELLAYLVDRRTLCTNSDIIASVWEGGISDSYFRTLRTGQTAMPPCRRSATLCSLITMSTPFTTGKPSSLPYMAPSAPRTNSPSSARSSIPSSGASGAGRWRTIPMPSSASCSTAFTA